MPTTVPAAVTDSSVVSAGPADVEPTVNPEQVPTPDVAAAEQPSTDAESTPADPVESTDSGGGSTESENPVTDDDLAATVAAMRALDGEEVVDPSLAPEPAFTVFGCNVPIEGEETANAVSASGDYLIAVAGLFGLIIARVRPRRKQKRSQKTPLERMGKR